MLVGVWHRDVAGQQIEQRRDVARALDARVAAHRHHPAAGAPDVSEQQLQHARGSDVLHPDGVLCPADGINERGRAIRTRVLGEQLADTRELVCGHAAHLLHHLRRVAGVVALQHLKDAPRVLEGLVARRLAAAVPALRSRETRCRRLRWRTPAAATSSNWSSRAGGRADVHPVICPADVVVALLTVKAREHPVEVLGVAELLGQDRRARSCRRERTRRSTSPARARG